MIRWRHYTEVLDIRSEVEWGIYEHYQAKKHTLAFKLFGRYLVITWVWDA